MSADRTFCNANEQTRRRWLKTPSQQLLRHRDKGLVWFLCAPNVRWSRRGRPDPLSVLVLSHLSSKHVCAFVWFAGSGRRERRELYKHPSPTCFLFPTHVFFPPLLLPLRSPTNNTRMSKSHRTQERQHTYLSLSTQKEWGVGGQRLFFFFLSFFQIRASASLCLVLFECIFLKTRKTRATHRSLMFAFYGPRSTYCFSSLFVVPFALIKTSKRLVDSTEDLIWGGGWKPCVSLCQLGVHVACTRARVCVCVCCDRRVAWEACTTARRRTCIESTGFNTRMRLFIYSWRCFSMERNDTPPADTRKTYEHLKHTYPLIY